MRPFGIRVVDFLVFGRKRGLTSERSQSKLPKCRNSEVAPAPTRSLGSFPEKCTRCSAARYVSRLLPSDTAANRQRREAPPVWFASRRGTTIRIPSKSQNEDPSVGFCSTSTHDGREPACLKERSARLGDYL